MTTKNIISGRIVDAQRLRCSSSGNPTWELSIELDDHSTVRLRTLANSTVGHQLTGNECGLHVFTIVKFRGHNRIVSATKFS